jgi:hypothetical protein
VVARGIGGNAVQPGAWVVDARQLGAGAPGAGEGFLGQVFGRGRIAHQPVQIIEDGGLELDEQPLEVVGQLCGAQRRNVGWAEGHGGGGQQGWGACHRVGR